MVQAIVVILLLLGGGTSYVAQGTVPGDALYPVKVDVNDNVRALLAVSDQAKAKLNLDLAHERLMEAEKLAASGKLNADASTQLQTRLKTHVDNAQKNTDAIEASGDLETAATVHATFEGMFKSYASVLKGINTQVNGNDNAALISDIEGYANNSAQAQARAGTHVDASSEAQVNATIKHADGLITATQAQLENTKANLAANEYTNAQTRLSDAEQAQAQAETLLGNGNYQDAYQQAQNAISAATEAKTMTESAIQLQSQFKIHVPDDEGEMEDDHGGAVGTGTQIRSGDDSEHGEDGGMQIQASSTIQIHGGEEGHDDGSDDGMEAHGGVSTGLASSTTNFQIKIPGEGEDD